MNIFRKSVGKILRGLVNRDFLGARFLNVIDYGVHYEKESGRIYQLVCDKHLYIAHPKHGLPNYSTIDSIDWLCREIYYSKYLPKSDDVVLDIGTGYGHEIVWLKNNSDPEVICVEPNPEVFFYLQVNLQDVEKVHFLNLFVGDKECINFPLSSEYASSTSQGADKGLKINGIKLSEIVRPYEKIALLKLNIEGGELELLADSDLTKIERIIVSCHDFRTERGDGEFFRTFEKVWKILSDAGYDLSTIECSYYPTPNWINSVRYWIYAERNKT